MVINIAMETFTEAREFADNPDFSRQRQDALSGLDLELIDKPIRGLIKGFSELSYCFTLQSCWGHFVYTGNKDPNNLNPLPGTRVPEDIEYRIAYIALCIQDCPEGRRLFDGLSRIPEIDRDYIQFGSAGWFWEKHLNSYALQVEPLRFSNSDTAVIKYEEALHIEVVKNHFFEKLDEIVAGLLST